MIRCFPSGSGSRIAEAVCVAAAALSILVGTPSHAWAQG